MKLKNVHREPAGLPDHVGGKCWTIWKKSDFLGTMTEVGLNLLDAGLDMELHVHDDEEEIYYIIGGVGEVTVGEETEGVKEGDSIYIPLKTLHGIKNVGGYPLVYLAVTANPIGLAKKNQVS